MQTQDFQEAPIFREVLVLIQNRTCACLPRLCHSHLIILAFRAPLSWMDPQLYNKAPIMILVHSTPSKVSSIREFPVPRLCRARGKFSSQVVQGFPILSSRTQLQCLSYRRNPGWISSRKILYTSRFCNNYCRDKIPCIYRTPVLNCKL